MRIGILTLSFLLLVIAFPSFCFAQSKVRSEREEILRLCDENFGQMIDKTLNLYEANSFYVLHMVFGRKGTAEKLEVVPKYYFEETHPEWKESEMFKYLSWTQFQNLLARTDLIKPKGELIDPPPSIGFVTNQTNWVSTGYKKAILTVGYLATPDQDENSPAEIKWFRAEFGKKLRKQNSAVKPNTKALDGLFKNKKSAPQD